MSFQPGWYKDPSGNSDTLRWWDGFQWTERTSSLSQASSQKAVFVQDGSQGNSGFGVAGFVLGIIAVATSWAPIYNYLSALIAVIGFVFSIVGIVMSWGDKQKKTNLSIAGVILCVVGFVSVIIVHVVFMSLVNNMVSELGELSNIISNSLYSS